MGSRCVAGGAAERMEIREGVG
ncbi:hypothetical protein LINPERPRIM_LOCUS15864 [Linum perenne]